MSIRSWPLSGSLNYYPFNKVLSLPDGWDYEDSIGKLELLLMLEGRGTGKIGGEEYKMDCIYDVIALYIREFKIT